MKIPTIRHDAEMPWMLEVSFPYDEEKMFRIKGLLGAKWLADRKVWLVPYESQREIETILGVSASPFLFGEVQSIAQGARPYQRTAIDSAILSPGGYILAHEMKLGKSFTALEIARMMGFHRILIICPAMSRPTWMAELKKWNQFPEHHKFSYTKDPARLAKKHLPDYEAHLVSDRRVTVVSYGLLSKLPMHTYDCIIVDEIQELGSEKSKQSKAVRVIRHGNLSAYVIGLSGTPQRKDTASLFNPIDTLFPGRFGGFYFPTAPLKSFAGRYCNVQWNGYGHDFLNIDFPSPDEKLRLEELKNRLANFMSRVTKAEVKHLLPAVSTTSARIDETFSLKELVEAELKGAPKVCLFFAKNQSWTEAYKELTALGIPMEILSGESTPEERAIKLQRLNEATKAIAICSIEACKLTIDLSQFTAVHFLEIKDGLASMSQVVGRFQVPEAKNPISITFWYNQESYEIAERLERQATAISSVMEAGSSEAQMRAAFANQTRFTEEEWTSAITDALSLVL